jgi:predicted outer membrane repeat protein
MKFRSAKAKLLHSENLFSEESDSPQGTTPTMKIVRSDDFSRRVISDFSRYYKQVIFKGAINKMTSHIETSTKLRTTLTWWSLTFTLVALFVAALSLAAPAHAAGVVGNGAPASCTEAALEAALAGGGVVSFNCGGPKSFTFSSEKVITQDTVIQGAPGANHIIRFNGGSAMRLFRVMAPAKLTLNDLTLEKGYNLLAGGAIFNQGTLALNNVWVEENRSGTCGGAIWSQGAVIIANSRFQKNRAASGGAICAAGASPIQMTNSRFYYNEAAQAGNNVGYGGAIFLNSTAALTITGARAELYDNKAQFGGALAIWSGATATVAGHLDPEGDSTIIYSNSATHSGGAIYNRGSLNLYDTYVALNIIREDITTNGYGGGVFSVGKLTIHNGYFNSNRGLIGGGLYLAGGPDSSAADIRQAHFSQNQAKFTGGGVFAYTTTLVMTNTTFAFNRAEGDGGGLACDRCARLRLSNSAFISNTAAYGGGLYVGGTAGSGYARVENVTFSGNQVTGFGGGVYNRGNLELYFSTLAYNYKAVHSFSGANTRFRSSVLHNPGYPNCSSYGAVQYSNDGANHVSDDSCGSQFTARGDPRLGPLQFELQQQYWPTYFHLPLAGSPLINAGFSPCPERDQRGRLRPDACDIGAVEYDGLLPVPTPNPTGYRVYLPIIVR